MDPRNSRQALIAFVAGVLAVVLWVWADSALHNRIDGPRQGVRSPPPGETADVPNRTPAPARASLPADERAPYDALTEPKSPPVRVLGRVVDRHGAGIANARLVHEDPPERPLELARSDLQGNLSANLRLDKTRTTRGSSRVYLAVHAEGFAAHVLEVPLETGSTLQLGTVTLFAGLEAWGTVVGLDGLALEGVPVYWMRGARLDSVQGVAPSSRHPASERRVFSDRRGRYRLPGIPALEGFLVAGDNVQGWTWQGPLSGRLGRSQEWNFVLDRSPSTRGLAVYVKGPDGRPFEGAWVKAERASRFGETDQDGRAFLLLARADAYRVTAFDPRHRTGSATKAVADPFQREIELSLPPPSTLVISIRDSAGHPVGAAAVGLSTQDRELAWLDVLSDARGEARLNSPARDFRLLVRSNGFAKFESARIPAETNAFRVQLNRKTSIQGRVTENGHP